MGTLNVQSKAKITLNPIVTYLRVGYPSATDCKLIRLIYICTSL